MRLILVVLSAYLFGFLTEKPSTYNYDFDYKLEYDVVRVKKNKTPFKFVYWVNSQKNDYSILLAFREKKKDYNLYFLQEDGPTVTRKFNRNKVDFSEENQLNLDYSIVYQNPYKYQVDNYDFFPMKDTILNGKSLKRVLLKSTNPERAAKKKLGTEHYLIDTTVVMAPTLRFATAYEIWKERGNFPNGLIREIHRFDNKNQLIEILRLTGYEKRSFHLRLVKKDEIEVYNSKN